MRTIIISCTVLLILMPISLQAQWYEQYYGSNENLHSISFVDSLHGWIAGDAGIYYTSDGGETWNMQQNVPAWNISFVNPLAGWADENAEKLIKTYDGGNDWDFIGVLGNRIMDLRFVDTLNGWATTSGYSFPRQWTIYSSQDGGTNWEEQYHNFGGGGETVKFVDTLTGVVLGSHFNNGNLLLTFDGGNTWSEIGIMCSDAIFLSETNGWVLNHQGDILHTTDLGQNWVVKYNGVDSLNYIIFTDEQHGWAVGENGLILHTDDGGENWQMQASPVNIELIKVEFVNENHGWIIGTEGVILHTSTGGTVKLEEIGNMTEINLRIFPNPASDQITISAGGYRIDELILYSISGQQILKRQNEGKMDVSAFPNGMYIIEVHVNDMIHRKRIIIK